MEHRTCRPDAADRHGDRRVGVRRPVAARPSRRWAQRHHRLRRRRLFRLGGRLAAWVHPIPRLPAAPPTRDPVRPLAVRGAGCCARRRDRLRARAACVHVARRPEHRPRRARRGSAWAAGGDLCRRALRGLGRRRVRRAHDVADRAAEHAAPAGAVRPRAAARGTGAPADHDPGGGRGGRADGARGRNPAVGGDSVRRRPWLDRRPFAPGAAASAAVRAGLRRGGRGGADHRLPAIPCRRRSANAALHRRGPAGSCRRSGRRPHPAAHDRRPAR